MFKRNVMPLHVQTGLVLCYETSIFTHLFLFSNYHNVSVQSVEKKTKSTEAVITRCVPFHQYQRLSM